MAVGESVEDGGELTICEAGDATSSSKRKKNQRKCRAKTANNQ